MDIRMTLKLLQKTFHGSLFSLKGPPKNLISNFVFFACWCGTGFESLSRDSCVMPVPLEIGSMRHHFWRLDWEVTLPGKGRQVGHLVPSTFLML